MPAQPSPPYLTPLDGPALRGLGIPEPWDYGIADRVRFYEIDALGHVNNIAYMRWFETIRVRWIDDLGLYAEGLQSVLRAQGCDYNAPMFLGESYVTTIRAASVGTTSIRTEYGVWAEGGLRASGFAVVVATDASGAKKAPVPEKVRKILLAGDGD